MFYEHSLLMSIVDESTIEYVDFSESILQIPVGIVFKGYKPPKV